MPTNTVHQISPIDNDGVVRCYAHHEPALLSVSNTPRNPNRGFYSCAKRRDDPERCTFWFWEDSPALRPPTSPPSPPSQPPARQMPSSPTRAVQAQKDPRTPSSALTPSDKKRRFEAIQQGLPTSPSKRPAIALPSPRQPLAAPIADSANPFVSSQPPVSGSQYALPPVPGSELAGPVISQVKGTDSEDDYDTDEYLVIEAPNMSAAPAPDAIDSSQHTVRAMRMPGSLVSPPASPRAASRTSSEPIEVDTDDEPVTSPVPKKDKGKGRAVPMDFEFGERASSPTRVAVPRSSSPGVESVATEADELTERVGESIWNLSARLDNLSKGPFSDIQIALATIDSAIQDESQNSLELARKVHAMENELAIRDARISVMEQEIEKLKRQKMAADKANAIKAEFIQTLRERIDFLEKGH